MSEMTAVTLDNCDREPIHIPGNIQPHGALLVFDKTGALIGWTANVSRVLHLDPVLGQHLSEISLDHTLQEVLQTLISDIDKGDVTPVMEETILHGQEFDLISHIFQERVIAEFEQRDQSVKDVAAFALKAHRAIDRLKRQKSTSALLQMAVEQVREITGFDRVMAYRFRHDDSGDIVAEACLDTLEPYIGRRYPASDIPAQARRLYILNTLRLISDVNYQPVPVIMKLGEKSLDMSFSVLRSVSPIHIEYLQNMGVQASMSVSIVINGKLWGLIACHHGSAKKVPYSIRMACDVLAQVLAATAQSLGSQNHAELIEEAADVRTHLMETLLHEDDLLRGLAKHADPLLKSLNAESLIVTQLGKLISVGDIEPVLANLIVHSLPVGGEDLLQRNRVEDWPEELRPLLGKWVGLLGLRFDPTIQGWVIALRPEQIETVRWGGRPEKEIKPGPLGPRLTPRGSFDEWRETVRGKAEPWDEVRLVIAKQLLSEMHRVSNMRHAETERARTQLLAMLGHDLRDPLNSISMAAQVLERGDQQQMIGQRIQASSSRMQRLISQVLDMSRIKGGVGLGLQKNKSNLAHLINDLIDEAKMAHPGVNYEVDLSGDIHCEIDTDRIAQVVSNLVSNARHHGEPGQPIGIKLYTQNDRVTIQVRNSGLPIEDSLVASLFNPFKRHSDSSVRNKSGLGLGLFIAHEIVTGHNGNIYYFYESPYIVFNVELPL